MTQHDVDAILSGSSDQVVNAQLTGLIASTFTGTGSQTADVLLFANAASSLVGSASHEGTLVPNRFVSANLPGSATQDASASIGMFLAASFAGVGSASSDLLLNSLFASLSSAGAGLLSANLSGQFSGLGTLSGLGVLAATADLSAPLEASFAGSATQQVSSLSLLVQIASTLSGSGSFSAVTAVPLTATFLGSSLVTSATHLMLGVRGEILGFGFVAGMSNVVSRPGMAPPLPAVNSAASLSQFIDALGLGRKAVKTVPANNMTVDPNPRRR